MFAKEIFIQFSLFEIVLSNYKLALFLLFRIALYINKIKNFVCLEALKSIKYIYIYIYI